jgi:hypothetical protein
MASASNQPVLEKEIVLISGGVESTTMLHMRYRTVTTALQQDISVTTALQHENARVDRPTIPYSVKDLIVPLFINYGEDFQQDFFHAVLDCCVSRAARGSHGTRSKPLAVLYAR